MKAVGAHITKAVTIGTIMKCDDNSGAKILKMIGMEKYRGRRGRSPFAGVADVIVCSVVDGKPEMRKKIERAVVIRQKHRYRRADGTRIEFEDNAAILINEKNEPKATEIKGVVAREVAERFPKVATIAKNVI